MSLIYCPECGHEVSAAAVACPNCGRPLSARPVIEPTPVVARVERKNGVPNWIFIPLGIIGAVLVIVFFVVMSRNSEDANSNLSVNVNARRPATAATDRVSTAEVPGSTITVPPATETQTVTVPGSQTSVPSSVPSAVASKGSVVIDARLASRNGATVPVKNEKFYLLDEDLESILSEARLEPIEGQTLMNSLGLSVLYPDRFSEFNRDALRAIKGHIKYAGTTDANGKAQLGGIEPNSYYLFGVTRSGRGFAIWSSPVSIIPGENALNLTPQRITEMDTAPSGE